MSIPDADDTLLDRAMALLQSGETLRAEELVRDAARAAEAEFGPKSPQHATAQNALGAVLMNLDRLDWAVDAFRQAAAVYIPDDTQVARDRLTYLMNLGYCLERAGRFPEAEQVLRDGLDARRLFYGRQHPGYAFGLEPLADLLLRTGKAREALEAIDETVENFWKNGHPRVATALALRAEILKAAEIDVSPFEKLDLLPDDIVGEMAETILSRIDYQRPAANLRRVLDDLLPLVTARFGEQHRLAILTLQHSANLDRHLDDPVAREAALRRLLAVAEAGGNDNLALQAVQGLALALSESGQQEQAEATYRDALRRAERRGDEALRSQVLRNFGLFLSENERKTEAEELLRAAVAAAAPTPDAEMLSRGQIALGVFLQHAGRLDEAKALLTAALGGIDPAHPDAVCARSHLDAVTAGSSCGCGDHAKALAAACREFILGRAPAGLLGDVTVELKDDDFQIGVHLDHEPTEEQLEQIERVIRHALDEFRKRLRQTP
jgi:tetratricopeptide (TPR) repeat protein